MPSLCKDLFLVLSCFTNILAPFLQGPSRCPACVWSCAGTWGRRSPSSTCCLRRSRSPTSPVNLSRTALRWETICWALVCSPHWLELKLVTATTISQAQPPVLFPESSNGHLAISASFLWAIPLRSAPALSFETVPYNFALSHFIATYNILFFISIVTGKKSSGISCQTC